MERESLQVGIVLSIEGEFLEGICPFVCLNLRVGHETIAHSGAEDLKCLFLVGNSAHVHNVVNIDEAFDGVRSFGSCLLVFIVLEETVALG